MIGSKQTDETDEPTRMFTGDIGDFIKKKKDYEEVPEEDAYEEILQSWERKQQRKTDKNASVKERIQAGFQRLSAKQDPGQTLRRDSRR